jgi:flagellar L-ring protein FlgH
VQEAAIASTSADLRAQRNTTLGAEIGSNRVGPHGVAANAGTGADGGGRTQRSGRLLATLTVRVTGLTAGGDLVVQGQQVLTINGESQSIVLSGVVRPRDVGDGNTVLSSRIADARIGFDGEGFIADKSRPSWISRFISALGF